ncbi:MAG: hypothetical protein E7619_00615 [Ruminococcaceae bacterium]|nr:hypothetical protein [Oscillospiraceae bacterium]
MILYHGSYTQDIDKLKPVSTRTNAISKAVVCLTSNPYIALFYIWSRPYKWVAFEEDENGRVIFTEQYDGMLFDFYNNVSGSIYECDGNNPQITQTHMKGVYISESPVSIQKENKIPNVYEEILKNESAGNIIVKRYSHLSDKEKNDISKTTVRAIHMQKLLFNPNNSAKAEMIDFVRTHFPKEWEIASKMSQQEIDGMIKEWKASLRGK